jgi:hypothetical protein
MKIIIDDKEEQAIEIDNLQVVNLKKDDAIIIQYKECLTMEQFDRLGKRMREFLPYENRVIVVEGDTGINILRKEE